MLKHLNKLALLDKKTDKNYHITTLTFLEFVYLSVKSLSVRLFVCEL